MKTYAYVSSETCTWTRAFAPGEYLDDVRVSRHGDLVPWRYGKRETLEILKRDGAANAWMRRAARAVAGMMGW